MGIGALICAAAIMGLFAWATTYKPGETTNEKKYDYTELTARIHRLTKTQQRIDELEQMIMDIELCEPGRMQKNFQFAWQSGEANRQYNFWTDGDNGTTDDMIYLAQRERQRLRTSLLAQIDSLYSARRNANVTQTVKNPAGEGSVYDE